jgi:hypothetical protein
MVVQRTIGTYPTAERALKVVGEKLGRPLTPEETDVATRMHQDPGGTYAVDKVVEILKARANPGSTTGPVTVVKQTTVDPSRATKSETDYKTSSTVSFEGEKAEATFEAFVDLQNPAPGTKVGYLQTLRFSRRSLVIDGIKNSAFDMANCRDGSEDKAPWMVQPVNATGRPVAVTMSDEPGQWANQGGGTVSATGADLFSTWLVATTVDTPKEVGEVQILYHWDWQIDWAAKSCSVTDAGPGLGSHSPALTGLGARRRYNDFLQSGQAGGTLKSRYETSIAQLREGLKGPDQDTSVDPALLTEIVDSMRTSWNRMTPWQRKPLSSDTIEVLQAYATRVQHLPAGSNLAQEMGFDKLGS